MDLASYMFIEPARDSQLFRDLEDLADNWPNRLAKCCNAIDAFVLDVYTPGYRVAPPTPGIRDQPDLSASVEVYLVPHLFEGPAALLRVTTSDERSLTWPSTRTTTATITRRNGRGF